MADNTVTGAVTSSIRPQARPTAVSGIGAKTPARQEEKAELSFMDRITNLFTGFGGKDPKEKPASVNTHNAKISVYQDMEDEARRSAELHRQDREGMGIARSLTPEQWAQRYSKEKGVTPNTTPPFWHQKQEHSEALAVIPVAETPIPTQSRGAGLMSPPSAGQLPAVDTATPNNGFSFNKTSVRLAKDLMRDFDLTATQAAAFVGNLAVETDRFNALQEYRPLVKGSRGGAGFAMWTGKRRVAFEDWAKQNELDVTSYEANYGYLKHELTTRLPNTIGNIGRNTISRLRNKEGLDAATDFVSKYYLRPGIPHLDMRRAYAAEILSLLE